MNNIENNKQIKFAILALFKGLDLDVQKELPAERVEQFYEVTRKELTLLADSASYGAGKNLLTRIDNGGSLEDLSRDINALIEYGILFEILSNEQRGEVMKSELQDEMRHFSRIMGLDSILSGKTILNLDPQEALRQCDDFARFLWLVFERRNQRGSNYELVNTGTKPQCVAFGNRFALIERSVGGNLKMIVELMGSEVSNLESKVVRSEINVLLSFVARYPLYQALLLFDYYLFLIEGNTSFSVVTVNEQLNTEGQRVAEMVLTGGTVVLLQKEDASFKQKVLGIVTCDSIGPLGSVSTSVCTKQIVIEGKKPTIAVLLSSELSKRLEDDALLSVVNTANSQGVINVANNLKNFCVDQKIDTGYSLCKLGSPQLQVNKISNLDCLTGKLPNVVVKAGSIIFEVAHLHADREPTETQFQTITARNILVEKLIGEGCKAVINDILMIDDYHVVNRLDYEKYFTELAIKGFVPYEVVPESSPLIADIAMDILQMLFIKDGGSGRLIKIQGTSVYLRINDQKMIELVEDLGGSESIGCVLFDAAFVLYKRNRKDCKSIYNSRNNASPSNDVHLEQIEYYKKEKDPERRMKYTRSLFNSLPTLHQLQEGSVGMSYLTSLKEGIEAPCVINVHEVFYRPQQAKVNALLDILREEKIYTLYIDPQSKQYIFEQSIVR